MDAKTHLLHMTYDLLISLLPVQSKCHKLKWKSNNKCSNNNAIYLNSRLTFSAPQALLTALLPLVHVACWFSEKAKWRKVRNAGGAALVQPSLLPSSHFLLCPAPPAFLPADLMRNVEGSSERWDEGCLWEQDWFNLPRSSLPFLPALSP